VFYGIDNDVYSLSFVDILMGIPRVSEEKAVAIVNQYKTVYNLMKHYSDLDEE